MEQLQTVVIQAVQLAEPSSSLSSNSDAEPSGGAARPCLQDGRGKRKEERVVALGMNPVREMYGTKAEDLLFVPQLRLGKEVAAPAAHKYPGPASSGPGMRDCQDRYVLG